MEQQFLDEIGDRCETVSSRKKIPCGILARSYEDIFQQLSSMEADRFGDY